MMKGSAFDTTTILKDLAARRDLSAEQMHGFLSSILAGECGDAETAAILIGLRSKGETGVELASAASFLRQHMIPLETGRDDLLDTCGTGGDEAGTFNISTATTLVAAGAGVHVVKHGNRAVSSRSGSADVLTALGVAIESSPFQALRCLDRAGVAFCFAPHYHPALKQVAALRRRLAVRTIFNFLGPLLNPAGACHQLIGVGHRELLSPLAEAVLRLGTRHAILVCGRDGLDEVTLSAITEVREVRGEEVSVHEWSAADFGLPFCRLEDLRTSGAEESASLILGILRGEQGSATNVVLANTAAALLAADRVATLSKGIESARESLQSGRALRVLENLVLCSNGTMDGPQEPV